MPLALFSFRRGFLPPLSPQPPFHPGGVERGSEQPHLSLSRRLGFYWLSTCGYACRTGERRRRRDGFRGLGAGVFAEIRGLAPSLPTSALSQREGACGALAGATKSNVAVGSPLSPAGRERGWGREWENPTPLSPRPPFHPSGVERGSEQPHLISSQRPRHHWPLLWKSVSVRVARARSNRCYASRRLAEAKKPNVAVSPPLSPAGRERGWGREWENLIESENSQFTPGAVQIQPFLIPHKAFSLTVESMVKQFLNPPNQPRLAHPRIHR